MFRIGLTVLGFIYLIFSIILLVLGLLRGEIFSTVCAAGLVLYFFIAAVSLLIGAFFWKKAMFKIELQNNIITVSILNEHKNAYKIFFVLPAVIPFYCFDFSTDKENPKSRKLFLRIKLNKTKISIPVPQNERGRFFSRYEYSELTDIAGFFSIKFFKKEKNIKELFLEPHIHKTNTFKLPEILNETSDNKNNLQRNNELYDVRPYMPGDDTRKINWKLFAHTQELSIKQGDFIPPPQIFFTLYIDTVSVFKYTNFLEKVYDEFINETASIAFFLYGRNISFNILFYDNLKKQFQTVSIFADDKAGIEKIKKTFCIPQIDIIYKKNGKHLQDIQLPPLASEDYKKNCLLCFYMPVCFSLFDLNRLIRFFSDYKHKCVFYFGPIKNIKTPKNILQRFLFQTYTEKRYNTLALKLNKCIETVTEEIGKEGFYAYSI